MSDDVWSPKNPYGSLVPILEASVEAAKESHPSYRSDGLTDADAAPVVLTLADRCDACGAAAVYRVAKDETTNVLDYCLHHWRKYVPQMTGWSVVGTNPDHPAFIAGEEDGHA